MSLQNFFSTPETASLAAHEVVPFYSSMQGSRRISGLPLQWEYKSLFIGVKREEFYMIFRCGTKKMLKTKRWMDEMERSHINKENINLSSQNISKY